MGSSAGAKNFYNAGTAAPTIQSMIDAEARRAHAQAQEVQRTKALAQKPRTKTQNSRSPAKKTKPKPKTRAQEAQRNKTLATAHTEADRTIARIQQLKETNANQTIKKRKATKTKQVTKTAGKPATGVSAFAILGTLFVSILMVFVVLAQINFNETAAESVRLNILIGELTERQRLLELSFESAVDIREVERFARDELGMSRPDARQVMVIEAAPRDIALALDSREDRGLQGFGVFLRSLTDYFRR